MFALSMSRVACRTRFATKITKSNNVRCMSIGDELRRKERVEEELYIKEEEKKFFEKKRAEKAAAEHDHEMAVYAEIVAPTMVQIQEMLKKTNDSVSDAGLEAIAKWKLGI